jgi:transcriptional regulator with XRE-family HTH domain
MVRGPDAQARGIKCRSDGGWQVGGASPPSDPFADATPLALLEAVADQVALSAEMISKIERGIAAPSFSTIEKLAEILEITRGRVLRRRPHRHRRRREDAHPLENSNQAFPFERGSIGQGR